MRTSKLPFSHACGVFGVFGVENVAQTIYLGLYGLQHRGQQGAGIAISDGSRISYQRDEGLLTDVFPASDSLKALGEGLCGIGHVRYCTQEDALPVNIQPFVAQYKGGPIAISLNGKLLNGGQLRSELEEDGAVFSTTIDTGTMSYLIAREVRGGAKLYEAVMAMMKKCVGSYAFCLLSGNQLIGARDPQGISPLCLGRLGDGYVLSSESCGLDAVGAEFLRDIEPGEVIVIDENGCESRRIKAEGDGLCIFEFVYFARNDSIIDSMSVYRARMAAGSILAKSNPVDADMVIGVPDSALAGALGYSQASGIPYGEGLAKNRYIGRTFIQPEQGMRERSVSIKLNAIRANVEGKRIIMVDDSIVRGTTSKHIVEMLRWAGAKEVHLRVISPPVMHSCPFGIDTPTEDQLIGAHKGAGEIREFIKADSLEYLDIEGLKQSVEGCKRGFCTGCFNRDYALDLD